MHLLVLSAFQNNDRFPPDIISTCDATTSFIARRTSSVTSPPPSQPPSLISPATERNRLHRGGDTVTPRTSQKPCFFFFLLLIKPQRVKWSRVLSLPDSYRLTLKHKSRVSRNREIDRQREAANTNRVGGDGSQLSSSVIILSISIFKIAAASFLSPLTICQRNRLKG